jgi:hypothetical protein
VKFIYTSIQGRILLIAIFFFLFSDISLISAENYFKISPGIKKAYSVIHNLKLKEGQKILDSLKRTEPGNMMVYHIEDYIDFYKIFINEDYNEFVQLEKNRDYRLSKIATGDKKSPYYRFCEAEIKLHWALGRLKFEEYFTTLRELKSAHDLLTENSRLYPDFAINKKSLSAIHALVGTFPDTYKNLLSLFSGLSGSIKIGAKEAEEAINFTKKKECLFKDEIYTIAAFIALHLENNKEKAWNLILSAKLKTSVSPLACFVVSNIASKTGRNDEAVSILIKRPVSKDRLPFYYLDYMLGKSLLYRLDTDANIHLLKFIQNFRGINYIKDAYLKLAWYELIIKKNENNYRKYIEKTIKEGKTIVDEDKTALKEASLSGSPNPDLLKSRLLFDGSYFTKAYKYLEINKSKFTASNKDYPEYNYRMGRILQMLNNNFDALTRFNNAIQIGKKNDFYFACSSALQSGIIYENMNDKKNAKKYYNICLNIEPQEYKNSLHQKAKAGLLRIK